MSYIDPQDKLREIMLLGIHPQFLKPSLRAPQPKGPKDMKAMAMKGIATVMENAAKRRAQHAPRVLALWSQGMSLSAIARETGVGREVVTRIVKEAA